MEATVIKMAPAFRSLPLFFTSLVAFAVAIAAQSPHVQPGHNVAITVTGDTGTLSAGNGIWVTASNAPPRPGIWTTTDSGICLSLMFSAARPISRPHMVG